MHAARQTTLTSEMAGLRTARTALSPWPLSFLLSMCVSLVFIAGCAWVLGIEDLPELADAGPVDGCGNGIQEFGEACDDGGVWCSPSRG